MIYTRLQMNRELRTHSDTSTQSNGIIQRHVHSKPHTQTGLAETTCFAVLCCVLFRFGLFHAQRAHFALSSQSDKVHWSVLRHLPIASHLFSSCLFPFCRMCLHCIYSLCVAWEIIFTVHLNRFSLKLPFADLLSHIPVYTFSSSCLFSGLPFRLPDLFILVGVFHPCDTG